MVSSDFTNDNSLATPLSCCTCLGVENSLYVSNCYGMSLSTLCDEEDPFSMDEDIKLENFLARMQSKYDAIIKNGTLSLCILLASKKAIGTKWIFKLKCKLDVNF